MDKSLNRKSNFELLRILSMIMIISHHISVHSGFSYPKDILSLNRCWVQFLNMWGKVGVNLFVLISGYFLSSSNNISVKKLIKLIFKIWFYSVSLFLGYVILYNKGFDGIKLSTVIRRFFPTTYSLWWFSTVYVFLYLTFPFINILTNNMNRKQHIVLLSVLTVLLSVISTFTLSSSFYSNYVWFVFLYLISSFIRKYDDLFFVMKKYWGLLFLLFAVLTYFSFIVLNLIGFGRFSTTFFGINKLSILLISISCFMFFKELDIPQSRFINTISSTTFGIYLIHDNIYGRPFFWKWLFKNSSFYSSKFLVINTFIEVIVVFIVCSLIDLIYQHTVEKLLMRILNNKKVEVWINKLSTLISV